MGFPWRQVGAVAIGLWACCVPFALADSPLTTAPATTASTTRPALKLVPETVADLRALQAQVESVVTKASPCVVGLRVKDGQGSGVIISSDGYVLTAGHVASEPGLDVSVLLLNGQRVRGKTLGINRTADSGLIKITSPPPDGGKWPFVEMGRSSELTKGQWCVAMGHPGGYKPGRTPPLRLGRVLDTRGTFIRTDCTLVGGDSGGPLFDLNGKVIGIHSRIGMTTNDNMHVPIDTFRDTWTRLAQGEAWGDSPFGSRRPWLGLDVDPKGAECRITQIQPRSPAEKAGLTVGDKIISFQGEKVANYQALAGKLITHKPGDHVMMEIERNDEVLTLRLTIGRRPFSNP